MIEGMWGTMKKFFPQAGPYNIEQNIMMFLWFKNKKAQGKSIFWSLVTLIAYRIFSVYRNTKTIHLIMMIWLVSFIISNYKLASGPPKDPGGSKKILSKSKDMIHRIFSVKTTIRPVPK